MCFVFLHFLFFNSGKNLLFDYVCSKVQYNKNQRSIEPPNFTWATWCFQSTNILIVITTWLSFVNERKKASNATLCNFGRQSCHLFVAF
ncbi:hypothetical protein BCR42DRAFT_428317 [Absidia repens]|uniref:Uncharacterized protein n=1 Tax=Absidia repens TaxID=90262 RepID=A0A1X2HYT2_9FUNG|nr:hypothetical protein BCR42DRAFT_428317 [Absidia repens]